MSVYFVDKETGEVALDMNEAIRKFIEAGHEIEIYSFSFNPDNYEMECE